jgi:secreted trypsin-like serine protease
MRSIRRMLLIPLAAVLMASLATSPAKAIVNGEPDNGRHPYVGLLVFDTVVDGVQAPAWRCTGSLLSPTVVLTAGHCTDGAVAARLWTDEDVQDNAEYPNSGSTSYDGTPYTNPDFCIGCGSGLPGFARRDIGIVVLNEPVPTTDVLEYATLPSTRYVNTLSRNAPVDLVGYGVQRRMRGHGQPVWTGLRVRLFANAQLVSGHFVHSAEFIRVTANPGRGGGATCFGDSGGPVLGNNSDTVLAVNSYVTNYNCMGVTYSQRVDVPEVLEWIESYLG